MADAETEEPIAQPADRVFRFAENVVYAFVGLLLLAAAIAVLVATGYHLVDGLNDGVEDSITATLDSLLLVFILLELLAGVRATMLERRLVAEPFLVVGIIASMKEIVVVALKAEGDGPQQAFENAMTEIGVLGGLVVLLAGATWLVRRKEREPTEDGG